MAGKPDVPLTMDAFSPANQPDEGYSEDPLNPPPRNAVLTSLATMRSPADLPTWLASNIAALPLSVRTELTLALLDELPTSTIAGIVQRLSPRLYIDFMRHLPAEICLKILSYLDPLSLVGVLQTCRAWYDLALDRKLWERMYHLEGWKAIYSEIELCEARVNENITTSIGQIHRMQSTEHHHHHHANKVRAIMNNDDEDVEMDDGQKTPGPKDSFNSASIFGSPTSSFSSSRRAVTPIAETADNSTLSSKGKGVDYQVVDGRSKRKAPEDSPELSLPSTIAADSKSAMRSSLWSWDIHSARYRINWKYLYNMRRRLESNWELGKFTTFMLPDPQYPEEGHQECVYTIQFDAKYLVSGSRDRTMRIWNMATRRLVRTPLQGHHGSVLCLQFDADPTEDLIVSGSSDSNVFIWKFSTGEILQKITRAHRESVLNVRFDKNILVTSSKDKTIKIFNRRPLRYGDVGYGPVQGVVDPVGVPVKRYGYEPDLAQELPIIPAYTQIARLDGHGAAVNAIQVRGHTIVSVSGDRQIKVWDWPRQVCEKTIPAHDKGIACVEYDSRRIVSGSSDYEVCIFDAPTGLKVASLRGHANLVRTVQAGFGDLPNSVIDDEADARATDAEFLRAVEAGELPSETVARKIRRGRRVANGGSSRPADVQAFGAKVPPGGGGGRKYGRIVSGSYDQSIIIWRRDKEGVWKPAHHLRQEAAAELALRRHADIHGSVPRPTIPTTAHLPLHPLNRHRTTQSVTNAALHPGVQPDITSTDRRSAGLFMALIDQVVPSGVAALQQALAAYPALLTYHNYLQATIERETSPFVRLQLRQTVTSALVNIQNGQSGRQRAATQSGAANTPQTVGGPSTANLLPEASSSSSSASATVNPDPDPDSGEVSQADTPPSTDSTVQPAALQTPTPAPAVPAQAIIGHLQAHGHHHPHLAAENAPARVFKLQFDARKIICCTQAQVIVGWDFCNGDAELEAASRFFATID